MEELLHRMTAEKCKVFFERLCPGIKQTITRWGVKKQKRILTDSVKNLHKKFVSEGGQILSYSKFCKLRPFWAVPAKDADRETCLCYVHENLKNMVHAMRTKGLLVVDDWNDLVPLFMCSVDSVDCAYSECSKCSQSEFRFTVVKVWLMLKFSFGSGRQARKFTHKMIRKSKIKLLRR